MAVGPRSQPVADSRGLVGSVVVHNQMDVQVGRHGRLNGVEELTELHGPMAGLALPNDLATLDIQGRKQGGGATAQIILCAPFHLARAQVPQGLGPIQGLDLRLLVHAQHQRPLWGIEIEAHHVPHLLDEEGIGRQLEGLGAVRLQAERPPDAADRAVAQPGPLRQGAGAPMRGIVGGGFQRDGQHLLYVVIGHRARPSAAGLIAQTVQSAGPEPGSPLAHGLVGNTQLGRHVDVAAPLGAGQDHARPQGQRLCRLGPPHPSGQRLPFIVWQRQRRQRSSHGHVHPPLVPFCTEDTAWPSLVLQTTVPLH